MNLSRFVLTINGFPIQKAERELSVIQSLSVDAFINWQEKKRWEIAKFHFVNNSFYRAKVGKYFPDRWEDLPIITKHDLQQPMVSLLTKGIEINDCHKAYTSGSSGVPLYYAKDKYTHAMTWALIANRYKWHGLDLDDKQARFMVQLRERRKRVREQFKDVLMNRVKCDVFNLSEDALNRYLLLFRKSKFKYIYGHTTALTAFANFLASKSIILKEVCPLLQLCISTSELSTERHTILFEKYFGVRHIREYGVSETCITGFDNNEQRLFLTEETLYNELINENNDIVSYGTSGSVLSTALFNKAYPMIRYNVGDELMLSDRNGSIYRTIEEFTGRTNDIITLPSGRKTGTLTIDSLMRVATEKIQVLKEFIIRQTAIDTFVFEVVTEREFSTEEMNIFLEKVALYLDTNLNIEVRYIDEIQRPPSGKLRFFYSELPS